MILKTFSYTLAAGEARRVSVRGRHVRGTAGDAPYNLRIGRDGAPTKFQTGIAFGGPGEFSELEIINDLAGASQTIEILVSDGVTDDNRLVGQIDITGGIRLAGNRTVDHGAVTVGTSAALVRAANDARNSILIQNLGADDIYIGDSGVTTANGLLVGKNGGTISFTAQTAIYGRSASAGNDVRYLEETL